MQSAHHHTEPSPYRFCYHCGSADVLPMDWRLVRCQNCGFSHYVTPTPAAVTLVLDQQERLLLMRRAHEPGKGKWGLPGGIVEPWETVEETASRELLEETGIDLPASAWTYLCTACNSYLYQHYKWPTLDIALLAVVEEMPKPQAQDGEAEDIQAISLHEIDAEGLAFPTHTEMVLKLRAQRKV